MATQYIDIDREIENIPLLPVTVNDVMYRINDDVRDYTMLSNIISKDPALVSRILIVANSSFYGFSGRINGIREACLILGLNTIRHIVFTAGILMRLSTDKTHRFNFDHNELWHHSIGVGVMAKVFAASVKEDPDSAFTCGLLHDIGELICDVYFTGQYAGVMEYCRREQCRVIDAENAVLGCDHCIIGAKVAGKWGLPDNVISVIQNHHKPSRTSPSPIVDLVHLGDVMIRDVRDEHEWRRKTPDIGQDAMTRLGITHRDIEAKLPDIKKEMEICEFMQG